MVEAKEEATREAVRGVAVEVAACFMREPLPPSDTGISGEESPLPSGPDDSDLD